MSDRIDENAGVTPAGEPAGEQTPPTPPAAAAAGAAPQAPSPAAVPPTDEEPTRVLADGAPATAAAGPAPAGPGAAAAGAPPSAGGTSPFAAAGASPLPPVAAYGAAELPRRRWLHRRWVQIAGIAAAAVLLFVAGGAIGALISGAGDRDDFRAGGAPGARFDHGGRGGHMDGRGGFFRGDGDGNRVVPNGQSGRNQVAPGGQQNQTTPNVTPSTGTQTN